MLVTADGDGGGIRDADDISVDGCMRCWYSMLLAAGGGGGGGGSISWEAVMFASAGTMISTGFRVADVVEDEKVLEDVDGCGGEDGIDWS